LKLPGNKKKHDGEAPVDTKAEWVTKLVCALTDFDGFILSDHPNKRRLLSAYNDLKTAAEKFTEKLLAFERQLRQWGRGDEANDWADYFAGVAQGEDWSACMDSLTNLFPDQDLAKDYLTAPGITEEYEIKLRDIAERGETPTNGYLAQIVEWMRCAEKSEGGKKLEHALSMELQGPKVRAVYRLEILSNRTGEPIGDKDWKRRLVLPPSSLLNYIEHPRLTAFDPVWRWAKAVIPRDRIGGKEQPARMAWRILKKLCEHDGEEQPTPLGWRTLTVPPTRVPEGSTRPRALFYQPPGSSPNRWTRPGHRPSIPMY